MLGTCFYEFDKCTYCKLLWINALNVNVNVDVVAKIGVVAENPMHCVCT